MRAEQLFAKASARSIDLKQLAGESANLYGAGSPRRRNLMERLAGLPVKETVEGKQSRVARPAYYSHAELGQALAGLTGPPYLAACYSFLLDEQVRTGLHWALVETAAKMARSDAWSVQVPGSSGAQHHYCDELCDLVLTEDWLKPLFVRVPHLYAIALDVSEEVWHARLMSRYVRLRARYDGWLGTARRYVDRALFEEFHRGELDVLSATG